jgi:UDP-GlcNAc3NAcA epimerase
MAPSRDIVTVVGARPQFIKAAVVSRALAALGLEERIIHTGQHYDYGMSQVFFDELSVPEPAANLGVGSAPHGRQTGLMLEALEAEFIARKGAVVLIYGDTNSTLAAALAAVKLGLPVAHVEAGLRSFNMRMPEEINRTLADKISTLLFCPTATAVENLSREGVSSGVHLVGDVMYDAALYYADRAPSLSQTAAKGLGNREFYLATVHRAENTDSPQRLRAIIGALSRLPRPVIMPLHPRTRKILAEAGMTPSESLRCVEPVGYLEMAALERAARIIFTDSGGIQKEAYFYRTPCVTLRDETEWVETVQEGWNILAGADAEKISAAAQRLESRPPDGRTDLFGDGRAGTTIAGILMEFVSRQS